MMAALGVVILYVGSLIEVLDISMAAIASLLCVLAVIEYGRGYAWLVFAATAILSMLVLPEKFTPSLYAFMIGYYPMVKELIERIGKKQIFRGARVMQWAIKMLFFNCALLVFAMIAIYLLALPREAEWMKITMFILANAAFVLYDIALTRLIGKYVFCLRRRIKLPGGRR